MASLKTRLKKASTATGDGVARSFLKSQASLFGSYRNALRMEAVSKRVHTEYTEETTTHSGGHWLYSQILGVPKNGIEEKKTTISKTLKPSSKRKKKLKIEAEVNSR